MQSQAAFSFLHIVSALGVAVVWIAAFSLLREPMQHKLSAIMIAGAGAAYLSGGLGAWEFVACAAFTAVAYKGLDDYRFIGLGWVMHTCWDLVHHFYGQPIIPIAPDSSAGCAICDLLLAAWYFLGPDQSSVLREHRTTSRRRFETACAGRWIIEPWERAQKNAF